VQARLFEPFFTTKPEGKGLGLGLALSAESLGAMGGRIVASNRPEGGARFVIELPAD
jgi:two-component system C4-dicarboxylate transport sensor histidine kinase DctB